MGALKNRSQDLEDFVISLGFGVLISQYTKYAVRYPDTLFQGPEVVIEIAIIGGYLLILYALSGFHYYGLHPEANHTDFFEEEGGYVIIAGILVLILMSLGSILQAANTQPFLPYQWPEWKSNSTINIEIPR